MNERVRAAGRAPPACRSDQLFRNTDTSNDRCVAFTRGPSHDVHAKRPVPSVGSINGFSSRAEVPADGFDFDDDFAAFNVAAFAAATRAAASAAACASAARTASSTGGLDA